MRLRPLVWLACLTFTLRPCCRSGAARVADRARRHGDGRRGAAARRPGGRPSTRAPRTPTKRPRTTRATTTSSSCAPARYEITVTLQGFQTFKATGVEVAHQPGRPHQRRAAAGGVDETVNVDGRAQVLNTDSATVSETIGERAIEELPLNGRNVWNLAATTPGVLSAGTSDIGLSFRGAGQREIQNSLSLDGINASSNLLAATSMRPIADAVTEVQVQTGSTSAEYGSYLGVHINIVTKSGTNDCTARSPTSIRATRSTRAATSRTAPTRRTRASAISSASRWTARWSSRPLQRPQQDVLHGRLRRRPLRGAVHRVRDGADRADARRATSPR